MPVPEAVVDLQIQSALISAGAALLGWRCCISSRRLANKKSTGQREGSALRKNCILKEWQPANMGIL